MTSWHIFQKFNTEVKFAKLLLLITYPIDTMWIFPLQGEKILKLDTKWIFKS